MSWVDIRSPNMLLKKFDDGALGNGLDQVGIVRLPGLVFLLKQFLLSRLAKVQ